MDISILLASKSPRRHQLMRMLGFPVTIISLDVDEHIDATIPVERVAETLALRKAAGCDRGRLQPSQILVTADTIVSLNGCKLGKPQNRDEAITMLTSLSGQRHTVYTGVCLTTRVRQRAFTESTDVCFRPLSRADIEHYVDTCLPFDKAGSYGVQDWIGMVGVERIEGCYYNVMGLPTSRLYQEIMHIV
ncbi:MAG: septum formation protein [bacterium P3]|nr:MAG: septum formation protein [bacterium P3]KWW40397.1 MAG: septum formation protein [bacterium F083]